MCVCANGARTYGSVTYRLYFSSDEKVNFAIQRGMEAARSRVLYFKHNDTEDLEKMLKQYDVDYAKVEEKST